MASGSNVPAESSRIKNEKADPLGSRPRDQMT
jgi:hypothetical protein